MGNIAQPVDKPEIHWDRCCAWGFGIVILRLAWGFLLFFLLAINEGSGPTEPDWLESLSRYSIPDAPLLQQFSGWLGWLFPLAIYCLSPFIIGFAGAAVIQALARRAKQRGKT